MNPPCGIRCANWGSSRLPTTKIAANRYVLALLSGKEYNFTVVDICLLFIRFCFYNATSDRMVQTYGKKLFPAIICRENNLSYRLLMLMITGYRLKDNIYRIPRTAVRGILCKLT